MVLSFHVPGDSISSMLLQQQLSDLHSRLWVDNRLQKIIDEIGSIKPEVPEIGELEIRLGKVRVGEPYVEGVEVDAVVEDVVKDKKIIVFKYKPKTKYRRKKGHRQIYYKVRVEGINVGGGIS